jgi:hypothetical protein
MARQDHAAEDADGEPRPTKDGDCHILQVVTTSSAADGTEKRVRDVLAEAVTG